MSNQARAVVSNRRAMAAVTAAWLLALVPQVADAAPAAPAALIDAVPQVRTLDELDTLLLARDRMKWSVMNEEDGKLIFGRPLADYASQYVFNPAADAKLKELRAEAAAQAAGGAKSGLVDSLGRARGAIELETYRLAALYAQETVSANFVAHEAALKTFMDKSPETEQRQTLARIEPVVAQARRHVDDLMQIPTLDGLRQAVESSPDSALAQVFNAERMRLAPFAAQWDRERGIAPMHRTRSKPCSPPYPQPSPTAKPQVDPALASQPDYPPEARRIGFEGKVHIRADISAKGCAERMEIARSSGVESLDAAALEWAEGLRFLPAQVDGKPQAASYTFGVAFNLTE